MAITTEEPFYKTPTRTHVKVLNMSSEGHVFLTRCGYCSYVTERNRRNRTVCDPIQMLTCTYIYLDEHGKQDEAYCRERCFPPCQYWTYTPTVTYSKVADAEDSEWVFLDVYFDRMSYTLLKHRPSMTMDNFVADVGKWFFHMIR